MYLNINSRIKNLFFYVQIFVSVLLIIIAIIFLQSGDILENEYSGVQFASIGSLGSGPNACYLPSDLTTLDTIKTTTESQVQIAESQLAILELKIDETVSKYNVQKVELEKLEKSILTDEVLIPKLEGINIVQRQLDELKKNSQESGVCSTAGYYDQESCENAGYFEGAYCTGGFSYSDQESCENAGYIYGGGCSDSSYTDKGSCENSGTSGYNDTYAYGGFGSGSCSNPAYTDRESCMNASYVTGSCSAPGYYDQQSCENAIQTYGNESCTGGSSYFDRNSCENAGFYPSYCTGGEQYQDENSCRSAMCAFSAPSCSDGISTTPEDCASNPSNIWTYELTTSCEYQWISSPGYGYQWISENYTRQDNVWTNKMVVSENNTWTEPAWYSSWNPWYWLGSNTWTEPIFQSYGYSWYPGGWYRYGYTWNITDNTVVISDLEKTLEKLKVQYNDNIEQNNKIKERILNTETEIIAVTKVLRDQTTGKSNLKVQIVEGRQKYNEIASELVSSAQYLCPTTEMYCSNSLDDDNDGQTDCSDLDCASDLICQMDRSINEGVINDVNYFDTILNFFDVNTTHDSSNTLLSDAEFIPIDVGAKVSIVSDRFLSILNLLKNNLSLLKQQNETTIIPAMNQIQTKVATGDYDELSTLMSKVQNDIDSLQTSVISYARDINLLNIENEQTTSDEDTKNEASVFAGTSKILLENYITYFNTLEKFLINGVPSSELYDELNQSILLLENSGEDFNVTASRLNYLIDSKNIENQNAVIATLLTPTSGSSFSYLMPPDKLSIKFNKPVEEFISGDITIRSDDSIFEVSILPVNSGDNFIDASFSPLQSGKTYFVTTDIKLQFAGKGYSLKNSWSFSIDADPTTITEKTIEENKENKALESNEEEVCDDYIDNNNDDNIDCNDPLCSDSPSCEEQVCGNGVLEESEECDDGEFNRDNTSNGCDTSCVSHRNCIDEDGDDYDDTTGEWCPSTEIKPPERGGSCLICQYEIDYVKGLENRLKNVCESHQADKKIIQKEKITGVEASQCPANTTTYKIRIEKHGCVKESYRISDALNSVLTYIRSNLSKSRIDGEIVVDAVDDGCHSAGGEFFDRNNLHNEFIQTAHYVAPEMYFPNDVYISQIANQTFGYIDNKRVTTVHGRVKLSTFLHSTEEKLFSKKIPNKSEKIKIQFSSCPQEGEACVASQNNPNIIQEAILCGDSLNPQRYYCSVKSDAEFDRGIYTGEWKETNK